MKKTPHKSTYLSRQSKLTSMIQTAELDAVAINPGPTLTYLTGLHFHMSERPVIWFHKPDATPVIALPELEAGKTDSLPFPIQSFTYGEDPETWSNTFRQALQAADIKKEDYIGVEPRRIRMLELNLLEQASDGVQIKDAEETLSSLRIHKDQTEISAMRRAVDIAQRAIKATLPFIKINMSERELAAELTLQLLRSGSLPEMPFFPIIASGPNSANPHAFPTDRLIAPGDLLIIDWGANSGGYLSDLTRTFAIGEVEPEHKRVSQIVEQANAAAREIAKPGTLASEVDRAARTVIEAAGFGKYFIHRTGHGLGMEGHEAPYIHAGNPVLLEEGMAFTIEPGIYIPGSGGIRIEDDVIVTSYGVESLSDLPRQLQVIAK